MQINTAKPTLGLAFSGSGNRSSFYVGFLEVLDEHSITVDHIAACSGGALAAAAYACGTLPEFKEKIFSLTRDSLKSYLVRTSNNGGLYNIDLFEELMREFTKGQNFEDVRPLMSFVAIDIETGEKVVLCMGDIAKAARISCTLPGVFEPVKWGGKTLVDGGLLTMVPGFALKRAGVDVSVGINMRGTKHIFTESQINAKKVLNFFKKILFINELEELFGNLLKLEELDFEKNPNFFQVVGKSLDLAIKANKNPKPEDEECTLVIEPKLPRLKQSEFSPEAVKYYYEMGREVALQYVPKINELLKVGVKQ
ncbi:MAG: patatin-like phospholipase family protein [Candidatus Doudnabacteria bacterium]|nr:patatin-like phospholipase family protein [Candidatus Doudnabacteria bacterium]